MLVCIYYYVVDTLFLFSGDTVLFIMNMFCIWWEVQASPEGYHHLCVHNVSLVNFFYSLLLYDWLTMQLYVHVCKRCVCWNMFVDQCSNFRSTLLEWNVCIYYHSALTPCNHGSWVVVPDHPWTTIVDLSRELVTTPNVGKIQPSGSALPFCHQHKGSVISVCKFQHFKRSENLISSQHVV